MAINPMVQALQGQPDPAMQALFAQPAPHLQRMAGEAIYPTQFGLQNYTSQDLDKMFKQPSGAAAVRAIGQRPSNVLPINPQVLDYMMRPGR